MDMDKKIVKNTHKNRGADGAPFDTDISWLGGYFQDGKVNVYLKQ